MTLSRILPDKLVARPMDGVVLGAMLALAVTSIGSYFLLDEWVVSSPSLQPTDWHGNFWVVVFTRLGKAWLQVWLLLIWFLVSGRRHDVRAALLAVIIVGATVNPLKVTVGRPRPYASLMAQETGQPERKIEDYVSFPSADTATSFGIMAAVVPVVGWPLRLLLVGLCAAIAVLRVATLAHYPSDVLAGAALGLFAGWLAIRLIDKWGWSDRPLPFERGLVFGGVVGIPAVVGLFQGPAMLTLVLETYGVVVACITLAVVLHRRCGKTSHNASA